MFIYLIQTYYKGFELRLGKSDILWGGLRQIQPSFPVFHVINALPNLLTIRIFFDPSLSDKMSDALQNDFNNVLRKGWPIMSGIAIPWNISIEKTTSFANPEINKWKRWGETRVGPKEVTHTNVVWNGVQIPVLPSIQSCQLEYRSPANEPGFFRQIKCYYSDEDAMKKELLENFGTSYEDRIYFRDRDDVDEEYSQLIWKPFDDFALFISFHPSSPVLVWIE